MLDAAGRRSVEDAIRDAERLTAGEIVVVVAREASRYRSLPFIYALCAGLVAPWPLLLWTGIGTRDILLAQIAIALAVLAIGAFAPLRTRLAPRALRRARAREAAEREFASHGMADTHGRTGVLLYLALAERHAEVMGDVTIADRVDPDAWRSIIEDLAASLGRNEAAEGLVRAVAAIGTVLARHAPPRDGDRDELPNRVVLI